jgi:hypothetical protein
VATLGVAGSAIFVAKPLGFVEINPWSSTVGDFYTEAPESFKLSQIGPFLENSYKIIETYKIHKKSNRSQKNTK